jgi:hypothetical protein
MKKIDKVPGFSKIKVAIVASVILGVGFFGVKFFDNETKQIDKEIAQPGDEYFGNMGGPENDSEYVDSGWIVDDIDDQEWLTQRLFLVFDKEISKYKKLPNKEKNGMVYDSGHFFSDPNRKGDYVTLEYLENYGPKIIQDYMLDDEFREIYDQPEKLFNELKLKEKEFRKEYFRTQEWINTLDYEISSMWNNLTDEILKQQRMRGL